MFTELKKEVLNANLALEKNNLVIFTWGNVSARINDYIIIKPSGIKYEDLTADDMVIVDFNGNIIEGHNKPSSDTLTHIEIYKAFSDVNGICHTHSDYATAFAQAGKQIECLGTTHADYFNGSIPCTRILTEEEVKSDYEKNTGKVIIETFNNLNYKEIPAILVNQHGLFTWGNSATDAVNNAIVAEKIANINFSTIKLNKNIKPVNDYLLEKHYSRKHGKNAYYGQ